MNRFALRLRDLAVVGVMAALGLALAMPASADTGAGSISVQATNNAAITLSVDDSSANFGTNIDPLGTNSNSSDHVVDFQGANGSYYVWGGNGGNGVTVTVRSNRSWTGTVTASENTGTSASMAIDSGVLRYTASAPASYYDAALATPFSTSGASFEVAGVKGIQVYSYYYALRVDWGDDPGTFASSVTYTATN